MTFKIHKKVKNTLESTTENLHGSIMDYRLFFLYKKI